MAGCSRRHTSSPRAALRTSFWRAWQRTKAPWSACARRLTAAVTENRRITPAAEWLLDNFYLIEEQISTAKRHLPKGYSRELPRLARGPSAGRPRVYDIALEIIAHGDGRVDTESLGRFVAAYQTVTR
jgi:cyclic beta-1,2-glucan synthetase